MFQAKQLMRTMDEFREERKQDGKGYAAISDKSGVEGFVKDLVKRMLATPACWKLALSTKQLEELLTNALLRKMEGLEVRLLHSSIRLNRGHLLSHQRFECSDFMCWKCNRDASWSSKCLQ